MEELIVVRGGGDLATGTIHRLWSAGFPVLVLETEHPAAIRRQVSLCEAVYEGETCVEGMTGVLIQSWEEAEKILSSGKVPVLADERAECVQRCRPGVVVDAILAKKNLGTSRSMAPLTIALGPGFTAGKEVDAVIETMRGHNLGRIIRQGEALANTGIPGLIGGYGAERVLHAQAQGVFCNVRKIGDYVQKGEVIASVETGRESVPVKASLSGIIRGLLRDGYPVTEGFKIADIDPRRGEMANCFTISDKARCIAGSVLELICAAQRKW
ncbi:MAG: selenium-dependent molybdenum cofactor biosynthesis protein YqeB [Eubacteriales bacterium]|nr:selenium-dependent molybdenum cofactor biosynthesis protein YqeB [Eubacteriales bacterium]